MENKESNSQGKIVADFGVEKEFQPCSWNVCGRGHKWPPTLGLAKCAGCGGPVLAVRMENCPICNEPVEEMVLRSDHLVQGAPIVKFCRGEMSPAEVTAIKLTREHAKVAEETPTGAVPVSVNREVTT